MQTMTSHLTKRIVDWSAVACLITVLLTASGCVSDKAANSDTPLEAARYAAIEPLLDSACAQFCGSFADALAARAEVDTALVPGLEWPFEMPPRRRDGESNLVGTDISWGVGYNRLLDTTRFAAFWKLGRFVDTGVMVHTSPIPATRIWHNVAYGRVEGSGKSAVSWTGTIDVSVSELDTESGELTASIVGSHTIGEECGGLACDVIEVGISNGRFSMNGDDYDLSTLSGVVYGTIKFTEFDRILGHDAVYIWELSGTVTDGVATIAASSGNFTASGSHSLCP